jgi:hypothetical protein
MEVKLASQVNRKVQPSKQRLKDCPEDYLVEQLREHLEFGHWIDVANYAFLLYQKKDSKP